MRSADPRQVLSDARTVAVVGCSADPSKSANRIPEMLLEHGYDVWPVNPNATEVLGRPSVATLADLAEAPDLVVVFRPSAEAAEVTRAAVDVGARAVWLQLGIRSAEAERIAADAGIDFVQNRCSAVDVRAFGIARR
jgi:predicted CoA-binding protein